MSGIFEKIRQEAGQEGERKGKAGLLLEQLEERFGRPPRELHDRILSADAASLTAWGRKFTRAPDLKSIFGW